MGRAAILLALLAAAPGAAADTLALKDGRFVEDRPIERTDQGYVVHYEHGDVVVPADLVLDHHRVGAEGEFVPVTEEEKERFAKGFVPWKGRWVTASQRDRLRAKEAEARALRLEQMRQRRKWAHHAEVKSRHFIFRHTLPDEAFQEFQELFETYYEYFTKYWKIRPSPKFGTPVINLYHDEEYFHQVSGAPQGVAGYYTPSERDLHFYYDRANKGFTIDVMFHEGNHLLTHMIDERMWYPWWISEGMAEYFGASEWNPAEGTMTTGLLQSGRLAVLHAAIADEKWLKLETLLEAERLGAVEYAWTWSFCHFLLSTPKYEKNFKKFYLAVARDRTIKRVPYFLDFQRVPAAEGIEAFKRYLKIKDLDALQEEWYDYIRNALDLNKVKLNWGDAGYIMSLYGEQAQARKFFKRAIDAGSKDAFVHYGYAELKFQQGMPKTALKYALLAIGYDPLHARAHALAGQAQIRVGEKEEGLRRLELAQEVDPEDERIWFALEMAKQSEKDAAENAPPPEEEED